jgi:LPXTG-motif cell wall-anchored protein
MSVLSLGAARAGVITVAAASALALLALPSAAHAAEVVTCTPQVTAESAPWLAFSQSENFYVAAGAAQTTYVTTTADLTLDFPETFTAEDLDDYEAGLEAASAALLAAQVELGEQNVLTVLTEQLEAADPDNSTGWQENLEALFTAFTTSPEATEYQNAVQAFSAAQADFLADANETLEADVPAGGPYASPVLPVSFEANVADVLTGIDTIVSQFQTIVIDGAAQFVVYEDVCVTTTVPDAAVAAAPAAPAKTLAATGTSDGLVLGSASGVLLLAGAATLILVRRRSA